MRSRFVTVDLETRSACDLKEHGGHVYAEHATTRLLTVAWHVDDEYHVWIPGHEEAPETLVDLHLRGVRVHFGATPPEIPTDRPWVGHNAFGFDELVWSRLGHVQPKKWIDSMALASAAGLPAGLQHIGERLWGEGKYKEGSNELIKASRATSINDCEAVDVPIGSTILVARYNVQDVRLTVDLMEELNESLHLPQHEHELLAAHREINNRGVQIDTALVSALYRLANDAVRDCVAEIAALTEGEFPDEPSLRKREKVIAWVERYGAKQHLMVSAVGRDGSRQKKATLRREVVSQLLAMYDESVKLPEQLDYDEEPDGSQIDGARLALVCRVLSLRQAALRITGAKLDAAGKRVDAMGIARALFAYWAAHTGRWAGRGIQVQNLPRPKEGVPVWALIREFRRTGQLDLNRVRAYLAADHRRVNAKRKKDGQAPLARPATADDAASGMIRSLFIPHEGDECLLAADLAAIEARVLAWLAGEEWLLNVFAKGGDPYVSFCERVTGERITKKDSRRQVWKVILLGAGYQLGAEKLAVYAASQGVDLSVAGLSPVDAIEAYRDAHSRIAGTVGGTFEDGRRWRTGGLWNDLNAAALEVVANGGSVDVARCTFYRERGHLYVRLPSGRELIYRNARIVNRVKWGKERPTVIYASPRWRTTELYGGKLAENITQAVASDFIRAALVKMRRAGLRVVLHVHDEIVASGWRHQLALFMQLITEVPEWATGFPLEAEGGWLPRYAKGPPKGLRWKEQVWRNGTRVK